MMEPADDTDEAEHGVAMHEGAFGGERSSGNDRGPAADEEPAQQVAVQTEGCVEETATFMTRWLGVTAQPVVTGEPQQPAAKPCLEYATAASCGGATFVSVDVETTGGRIAEICQLAAYDGFRSFSVYVMPEGEIVRHATRVHGLSVHYRRGKRTLRKHRRTVGSALSVQAAMQRFHAWLQGRGGAIVLMAHNGKTCDFPLLLRTAAVCGTREQLEKVWYLDTLSYFREAVKSKQCALLQPAAEGEKVALSLSSIYAKLFPGEEFGAHDALEDCAALYRIMFRSPLLLKAPDLLPFVFMGRSFVMLRDYNEMQKMGGAVAE